MGFDVIVVVHQTVVVRALTPCNVATNISEEDFPSSSESGIVCVLEPLRSDELGIFIG